MKVNVNGQKWYQFSKLKDKRKKFMFTVYTSYTTYLLVHRGLQFFRWAVKLIEMSMYLIVSIIDLSLVLIWSTDWSHCPINETKTIFKGSSSMKVGCAYSSSLELNLLTIIDFWTFISAAGSLWTGWITLDKNKSFDFLKMIITHIF